MAENKTNKEEKKTSGTRIKFRPKMILDGSFLMQDAVVKQIKFILFIAGLFMLYIWKSYVSERTVIKIAKTKTEIIELKSEYITAKSRLTTSTNLSSLARSMQKHGLKPSQTPPYKIFVKASTDNE